MTPPPAPPSLIDGIYLDDLGELIAGIPSMIGFPPVDSIVLVTFHVTDRLQFGATVRMDLPEPRHGPDMVSQLCLATVAHEPDVAVPVIIGGGSVDPPELPYRWLMELVAKELGEVEIFACGPTPMLEVITQVARAFHVPCQVSLEEFMACAVGGCAGCTVQVQTHEGAAMKRVCVDGPVFDAYTVFQGPH